MIIINDSGSRWSKVVYFEIGNKQVSFVLNETQRGELKIQNKGMDKFTIPSKSDAQLNSKEQRVVIRVMFSDTLTWFVK